MATNPDDTGASTTFESFIASERERLTQERTRLFDQQKELEDRLEAINRELAAIKAYEDAKAGKLPSAQGKQPRAPRAPREGGRGEKRAQLLQLLKDSFPNGATRADLLAELNISERDEDGKRQAQSVSNSLSALLKAGQLVREGRTYRVA